MARREAEARAVELGQEEDAGAALAEEIRQVEQQRAATASESAAQRADQAELESALEIGGSKMWS